MLRNALINLVFALVIPAFHYPDALYVWPVGLTSSPILKRTISLYIEIYILKFTRIFRYLPYFLFHSHLYSFQDPANSSRSARSTPRRSSAHPLSCWLPNFLVCLYLCLPVALKDKGESTRLPTMYGCCSPSSSHVCPSGSAESFSVASTPPSLTMRRRSAGYHPLRRDWFLGRPCLSWTSTHSHLVSRPLYSSADPLHTSKAMNLQYHGYA